MSEKKTISGVRKDLLPSEFKAKMDSVTPKGQKRMSKVKGFFGNLTEYLSAFGLFPVLSKESKQPRGRMYSNEPPPSPSASFRESQRFDPERAYIQRMQEVAYHQMVDGKGDPEPCDCDHDR